MTFPFDQRRYLIPFRSMLLPHILTDTLVVGGGVAGMRAALEAARHGEVICLLKMPPEDTSTAWAQGGIAAACDEADSVEAHLEDTLAAGAGLCDEPAVRTLVEEGPGEIEWLVEHGMRFDRQPDGRLHLTREGGHRRHRVVHTDGAATGRELVRCLRALTEAQRRIRVFDHCFALDLLALPGPINGEPRVLGAITQHRRYGLQIIWAKATVLATGGVGQVFRETSNPAGCTGDGLAMAWRAGAVLSDVELVQFHPTTLYVAGATRSLISEAVRGEGAHLVDRQGRRFMEAHHEMAELAPRDVVSRSIIDELAATQEAAVYLDARHLGDRFAERFPGLAATLRSFDLDPARDLVPVHPAAHYTIGGVRTDLDGRSSLPGLYACGEAAANGLHGANRLASNSLLEGLVYGRRTGAAVAEMGDVGRTPVQIVSDIREDEHGELDLEDVRSSLRSAMWRNAGIKRTGAKLDDMLDMCAFWARYTLANIFDEPVGWETQNLLTVAALITRAAAWRRETRGVHTRADHAGPDESYRRHADWRIGREEPEIRPPRGPEERAPAAGAAAGHA